MGANNAQERERKEEDRDAKELADFRDSAEYLARKWINEMSTSGDQVNGYSLTRKPDGWLLVVRAVVDGVAQVAFLFDQTPTGCVNLAALKARQGTLRWRDDEYA